MPWFSVLCYQIIPLNLSLSSPCSISAYLVMFHLLLPPKSILPAKLALLKPILNSSNDIFAQIWLLSLFSQAVSQHGSSMFESESTWLPWVNLSKLFNKDWSPTSKTEVKWFWLQNFCPLRALFNLWYKSEVSLWWGILFGEVLTLSDYHNVVCIAKTASLLTEMCSTIPLIKGL